MKHFYILLALVVLTTSVSAQRKLKVLFIGNSYTYVNDLPNMIAQFAGGQHDTLVYSSSAPGGYTLQQHSSYAPTLALIAQGGWDYVVLQEQSQLPSFPPGQVEQQVYPYAHILDSLIHVVDSCTETVFYLTWGKKRGDAGNCAGYPPVCTYTGCQDRLSASYLEMGQLNHATVVPAGEAWRRVIAEDSTIELYNADESHPSIHGTYLTAATFYTILFGRPVATDTFVTSGISQADALTLRRAAQNTASDSLSKWLSGGHIPVASFTHVITGADVQFTSTGINGESFAWQFGDGTTGTGPAPVHTYTSSGNFLTTLTVTDRCKQASYQHYVSLIVSPSGIQQPDADHVRVYPNPASTVIYIDIKTSQAKGDITLINAAGAMVRKISPASSVVSVPVSDLPAGIYTVTIGERSYAVSIAR